MKNRNVVIGVGIAVLLYFLWSRSQKKSTASSQAISDSKDTTDDGGTTSDIGSTNDTTSNTGNTTPTTTVTETKLDTSGIPKECINGFELNGKKYFIKDNKFQKE